MGAAGLIEETEGGYHPPGHSCRPVRHHRHAFEPVCGRESACRPASASCCCFY